MFRDTYTQNNGLVGIAQAGSHSPWAVWQAATDPEEMNCAVRQHQTVCCICSTLWSAEIQVFCKSSCWKMNSCSWQQNSHLCEHMHECCGGEKVNPFRVCFQCNDQFLGFLAPGLKASADVTSQVCVAVLKLSLGRCWARAALVKGKDSVVRREWEANAMETKPANFAGPQSVGVVLFWAEMHESTGMRYQSSSGQS